MSNTFYRTLDRTFITSLLLLLVTSVISFTIISRANDRSHWVNHTYEVISKLELVISDMKDAETGTRGYLINGDTVYLQPYKYAYEKTMNAFQDIKTLTIDNAQQQSTIPQLERAINNVFSVLRLAIATKQQQGNVPNTILLQGKQTMDKSRSIVYLMQSREEKLLDIRTKQWQQLSFITPFLIIIIFITAVIVAYYFAHQLAKSFNRSHELQQELQKKNNEIAKRVSIIQDVANHIAAGEYSMRLEAREKDILGVLSENLNRMAASLEYSFNTLKELNQKKDDFIGMAAHELKTPISSVKAYLQIVSRTPLEGDEGKRVYPFITKANHQINRIINIISDLLDVTKINARQLELQLTKVPVRELIIDSAQELFLQSRTHILSLEGDPDLIIKVDKFRIEQVFINILSNAIKYSAPGTRIIVTVIKEPPFVKVSVTDFGIGIPSEKIPFIFERYYRVDDTSPATSGLGLGLYITKDIIERHGGTIIVNSTPDVGSTFTFTLPLAVD